MSSITDDSTEFKDALQIWSDVIQQRRNTPRAVKRYLNRSRYLAVRLREDEQAAAASPQAKAGSLDEQTLVALSALHHIDPDLLTCDLTHTAAASDLVRAAIAAHRDKYQHWPPSRTQIAEFKRMAAGIKT